MYYPVNSIENCFIFNKSLVQDLENYSLEWSNNDLHIVYDNESISQDNKINFKIADLINLIPSTSSNDDINIWQPLLLDESSSLVSYLPVLNKTLNDNPILGIDKILSFKPKFKNWNIENIAGNPASMVCNWYTNSILGSSLVSYGVLCWYKYTDYNINNGVPYSQLSNDSKFMLDSSLSYRTGETSTDSVSSNTILVKFNKDYIKRLDKSNAIILSNSNASNRSNPISFNTEQQLISISSITNSSILDNCKLIKDTTFVKNGKNIDLFISDGECFSYYYGLADKLRNHNKGMSSRTYISPKLHKIYREIYHRLTLHKKILTSDYKATMNLKQARLFQKLCYFIASAPTIDRTTIDFLSDKSIYNMVINYINEPVPDKITEITKLKSILKTIFTKYKSLSSYNYKSSILSNYVSNKKDLFRAIMNKYSAGLWVEGHTKLTYKSKLVNGPHAYISTQTFNWRPKSIPQTQMSYNNSYIKIGNISYSTDFSPTNSIIKVKADNLSDTIEIPLADISLVKYKAPPLYVGTGIYKSDNDRNYDNEIVFQTDTSNLFGLPDSINFGAGSVISTDYSVLYTFEQVSGPLCLRFDNLSKSKLKKYKQTTQLEGPNVYIRQSGTYEIKCTRNNYGRIESDTLTVTTDPNYIDTVLTIPTIPTPYPKLITSTIKSIAFNKRGLIWIIDSENYIDTNIMFDKDDIDIPGILKMKDIQFDINSTLNYPYNSFHNSNQKLTILENNADLSIGFNASIGDCPFFINSIIIENMRDNNYKYCQCKSFYKEKIKRKRRRLVLNDIPTFGNSDFIREIIKNYQLYYHNINGKINDEYNILLTTPDKISTIYSPPVLAYGGYTKNITDIIGINLPSHPQPRPSGSGLENIINIDNHKLPYITDRYNVLSNDDNNPIYCYLQELQPSGDNNYITLSKGHFHPISGWVSNNTDLIGKSNVVSNKLELKNSYKFDGIGFISLKNLPNTSINSYISSIRLKTEDFDTSDISFNYAYGSISKNGTSSKFNHNFYIEDVADDWANSLSCENNTYINYSLNNIIANKTIDSIEVQLKFLNHINPKNLIVSLIVENNNNTTTPTNSGIDANKLFSAQQDLNNYLNNTTGINTNGINKHETMLLFGDHLDHYDHNFSISFTDRADKNIVTHNVSYFDNPPGFQQESIKNYGKINAAIGVLDKTQKDIKIYNYAIKMNQLNQINNSLNKCRGMQLNGTTFSLQIKNIEPIENDPSFIMDNLNNNFIITSDNINYSNTLDDSLCSWSVIVHTTKLSDSVDSDILGYIDYKNSISELYPTGTTLVSNTENSYNGLYTPVNISGYDFIGNFKNKNFLIPLININAPYNYLSSVSQCFYDDPDVLNVISPLPPEFPSLLGYNSIRGGGTSDLGYGGRLDPIIGYLTSIREFRLSMVNNSQFFKPVYSTKSFGHSDRAIVAISQDGALWYNTEISIFKYSNTPTVQKNIYKYIKLNTSSPKFLSQFSFQKLKNISELNLVNCVGTISANVSDKTGLKNINNLNLKHLDIVLLTNQNNWSDNGYWRVYENESWVKIPCDDCISPDFLAYNNIDKKLIDTIKSSGTISQNILINNIRAYNFFDINETVELSVPSGATSTVLGKSIISTNSGQKTVLTLSSVPSGNGNIFKQNNDANVLFLYKDNMVTPTGYYKSNEVLFNAWSLDNAKSHSIKPQTPSTRISTIGEGNIGWGTDSIFPTPLSLMELSDNKHIYDHKFNNQFNDNYHLEKLTIIDQNNNTTIINVNHSDDNKNKIKMSSYSLEAFGSKFNDIKQQYTDNADLNGFFKKINQFAEYDKKNISFIDLKSDKFISVPDSGLIVIEGDYLFNKIIKFTDSDIELMNNRLNSLLSFSENFDPNTVTDLNSISSIQDLIKYYNSLPKDTGTCYQTNKPTNLVCNKLLANKKLNELYQEKHNIQKALEVNQSDIELPHISGIVVGNLQNGLSINYQQNDDLYWIHIDPNQKCIINDELSVKILRSIEISYVPISTNIYPDNIITPSPVIGSQLERQSSANPNAKINFFQSGNQIIRIPESIIQSNKQAIKQKYPSLNWSNDDVFYYGNTLSEYANSKKFMINDGQDRDYILIYKEEYIRPDGLLNDKKISEAIDLSSNSIKIQFRNITRKIKSIDSENFDRYGYDYDGNLIKDTRLPSTVGQIANNFVCWHCVNMQGEYTSIPPFLIAANEMRYRAFFGSIDGMEHKNTNRSDSLEDWEWIPFEYYTSGNAPS